MRLQVLVVDDNRQLAENLAEILTEEGCEVRTAFSAEEALLAADTVRFDLVLTDIRMPGMNGIELIGRLAQREPRATFLLMTAYSSDQMLSAASHLGVIRAVLAKPLAVEQLLALLPRARACVLLVEDDRRLAATLEHSLRSAGYTVHLGESLASAQAALASAHPDIAVIDGSLQGGHGMAFARALCSSAANRVPMILFTGLGREADEAELRGAAHSAIQVIHQPVSPESVLTAIAQIEQEGKP